MRQQRFAQKLFTQTQLSKYLPNSRQISLLRENWTLVESVFEIRPLLFWLYVSNKGFKTVELFEKF